MTFATTFNGQIENDFRHDATLSRATAGAKNSRLLQVYTGQKSAQRANRAGAVLRICGAGILPVCFPSRTLTIHGGRPIEIQSNDRQNDAEPAFGPAARGLRARRGWRTAFAAIGAERKACRLLSFSRANSPERM
ncbi:hypothetical protein N2603_27515 [Bradyrhizobium huanghuaihaiense]|uniref:hypothetical protein n=1 Tax=Bradyrhizobium huanghuaihaiense TaxID=990078 RepID=UPI0021AA8887|nr:hypothetical protein [Bradyrhizobium sp. CB3035]UWU73820.1 hypothetical protein N2603_27515 [Bradyrhizobium sp. CB3035]